MSVVIDDVVRGGNLVLQQSAFDGASRTGGRRFPEIGAPEGALEGIQTPNLLILSGRPLRADGVR